MKTETSHVITGEMMHRWIDHTRSGPYSSVPVGRLDEILTKKLGMVKLQSKKPTPDSEVWDFENTLL